MPRALPLALFVANALLPVYADTLAEVQGVQMPGWVERAGVRLPVRAGMPLEPADVLETGTQGRIVVQLLDGGTLKVGELARVAVVDLRGPTAEDARFHALFEARTGVLRLTTSDVKQISLRDVVVRTPGLTANLAGGDMWVRSMNDGDLVCLVEGGASVTHASTGAVSLTQPLTYVMAARNDVPQPMATADADRLKAWLAQTELEPGAGVSLPHGGWVVQVTAEPDAHSAESARERLQKAGYAADLVLTQVKGKTYHRVRLSGFDTQADAKSVAQKIDGKFAGTTPWVALESNGSQ
jgi:hypothetical protein